MALAPNDIIRVKWRATAINEEVQYQQTFKVVIAPGAAGTLPSLFAIASFFANDAAFGGPSAVTNAWLQMLPSGVSMYKVEAQRLLPTKTIYVQREAAIAGTGGTGPRATNTCAVYSLVTALPGRSQIAKFHVGPIPDAYMVSGALSTTALTALRALAQASQANSALQVLAPLDLELAPVILHRNPNANPRYSDVASYRINFYVRTQRRRTVKIGK